MAVNIYPGPYSAPAQTYHQPGGLYTRTVRVTASTNNPLTLTGSYAGNSAFLIMNTGSVYLWAKDGTAYGASNFHEPSQNHQIFPIELSYVSASGGGDITILYR